MTRHMVCTYVLWRAVWLAVGLALLMLQWVWLLLVLHSVWMLLEIL